MGCLAGLGMYRVLKRTMVRAGPEGDSAKVGPADVGEYIEEISQTVNSEGVLRVQFARGWVSMKASNGAELLAPALGFSLGARRLAVAKTAAAQADAFHHAKWQGGFADRWPSYNQLVGRTERGLQTTKDVATFIQKRSAMEEQCAQNLRGCLGDSLLATQASAALSAAKGSALGWLSGATGGEKKPIEKPKTGGQLPAETTFAKEPFGSLRESLLGVLVVDSARRVEEHKAKAAKLKALAAELGEFVTKHAARREALLKEGSSRLLKLDEAFAAVKKNEGEFDRLSSQATQVEQEYMRTVEDARMAKSPAVERLSAQMQDLGAKRQQAEANFRESLEVGMKLEKGVYDRDLPHVLADFRRMEETRLWRVADTVGQLLNILGSDANDEAAMQPILQLCLAPVDAAFDMDIFSAETAVPTEGTVPSGYLCLPRKLCERISEVGGVLPEGSERNVISFDLPSVKLDSLTVGADGLPKAAVALCERVAAASSPLPALDTDDWNEVAELYSQLGSDNFSELATAASPAVCLRALHRLLRTLSAPLLPLPAYKAVIGSFAEPPPQPENGNAVPVPAVASVAGAVEKAMAEIVSLAPLPRTQLALRVMQACASVAKRSSAPAIVARGMSTSLASSCMWSSTSIQQEDLRAPAKEVAFVTAIARLEIDKMEPEPAHDGAAVQVGVVDAADLVKATKAATAAKALAVQAQAEAAEAKATAATAVQAAAKAEAEKTAQAEAMARIEFKLQALQGSTVDKAEYERVEAALVAAESKVAVTTKEPNLLAVSGVVAEPAAELGLSVAAKEEIGHLKAALAESQAQCTVLEDLVRQGEKQHLEAAQAAAAAASGEDKVAASTAAATAQAAEAAAKASANIEALKAQVKTAQAATEKARTEKARALKEKETTTAALEAEVEALTIKLTRSEEQARSTIESTKRAHAQELVSVGEKHSVRLKSYESDQAQVVQESEEAQAKLRKLLTQAQASQKESSAVAAREQRALATELEEQRAALQKLQTEAAAGVGDVQAQMEQVSGALGTKVKELSETLARSSQQLAQSEKEKKLYVEAVKMLKLRLYAVLLHTVFLHTLLRLACS